MGLSTEDNRFTHWSLCYLLKITDLVVGLSTEDNRFTHGSWCYVPKITDLFMGHGAMYCTEDNRFMGHRAIY